MGQKVNPICMRLGVNRTWDSRWFANAKTFPDLLHEDIAIRKYHDQEVGPTGWRLAHRDRTPCWQSEGDHSLGSPRVL